jgi:hypothetical protein
MTKVKKKLSFLAVRLNLIVIIIVNKTMLFTLSFYGIYLFNIKINLYWLFMIITQEYMRFGSSYSWFEVHISRCYKAQIIILLIVEFFPIFCIIC